MSGMGSIGTEHQFCSRCGVVSLSDPGPLRDVRLTWCVHLTFSPSPQHTDSHIPCGYHKTPTIPQAFHSVLLGYTWALLLLCPDLFLPQPFPSHPLLQSIMASLGSGDLVDVVSPSASTVVYPTNNAILQTLQAAGIRMPLPIRLFSATITPLTLRSGCPSLPSNEEGSMSKLYIVIGSLWQFQNTCEHVNPNASCHGHYFELHFNGHA